MSDVPFIDLRKWNQYPERACVADFINDDPDATSQQFECMRKAFQLSGFVLLTYSVSIDGKHRQGMWLSQADFELYKESVTQMTRDPVETPVPVGNWGNTTLWGTLQL